MLFTALNCIITLYYSSASGKADNMIEIGKGHRSVDQQAHNQIEQIGLYLRNIGIRPSVKAYQYLTFALVQLQQGTPFRESIWELTAIHFNQSRKNVLACVRREITRSFAEDPARFAYYFGEEPLKNPPSASRFLQLSLRIIGPHSKEK